MVKEPASGEGQEEKKESMLESKEENEAVINDVEDFGDVKEINEDET